MAVIVSATASGALWEAGKTPSFWFLAGGVATTLALGMLASSSLVGRLVGRAVRVMATPT